jgi:AAA family ATP:ADP antiporter
LKRLGDGIERVVGSDVHDGEWRLVLLFFANLFLLLTAYYILKVIREPLILLAGGAVRRSYARGLQAGLLVLLIPAYSTLANRIEPSRLVKWIMAVFVVSLALFFAAGRAGVPIGFAFFVWLGIFSTLSIAQFWSLANDIMTEAEGKRLFPLVAAGGAMGGILGAQFAARAMGWLSPNQMMLVAAALLACCFGLTHAGHDAGLGHRARVPDGPPQERDRRGAFALVLQDRYLLLIGLSVIVLNLITATGDFMLAQMVTAKAQTLAAGARGHFVGAFYGDLQTWVSVLTAGVQILFVARAFKAVGVGGALFFMPLLVMAGYGAFALLPVLALGTVVKVAEGTTDYSLQNTIQQVLFLPTSRDAKYKAKSAIDTVSKRLGDLGSTALVFAGVHLGFSVLGFAVANVVAAMVWTWMCVHLRRRQAALAAGAAAAEPNAAPESTSPRVPSIA